MKILFTGGGTAGHIFPIIAVAREIKKIHPEDDLQLFYVGPKDQFSENLLLNEGFVVKRILAGKIRRYLGVKPFFQNILDIFIKIPFGFFHGFARVFLISPDLIFSKGGYGSFSVVFSGWLMLIPVFLHESDVVPGLTNRLMGTLCLEIFVSFPIEKTLYFPSKKMISVGNPIRKEILGGNKSKAKELFLLTGEKPLILILGGSLGAQRINDVILSVLPELLQSFEIIHQTGHKNFKGVDAEVKAVLDQKLQKYYHPFPFLKESELKQALAAANLIVSRAGSGSIFEIASVGKPSVLIPLPESAQNHQLKNAYAYAESGASLVVEEYNFTPHFFSERLRYLFYESGQLKAMTEATKTFARPEAGKIIARYLMDYLLQ
jgi:UDP-N-acetylglucosamine--N-acetylmuramyl-(pentapeptide) pyrophosphoryl-undecaprenol N-acetylglucosamine transferase